MKRERRIKRNPKHLKKLVGTVDFQVTKAKEEEGGGEKMVIRGLANANVVDRGKERITTDAWQLENFMKNPVILVNHGFDIMGGLPIGKAIKVEPSDEGLIIEAEISNSKNGAIPMIADLIKDGYLSTFSVGFDLLEGKEEVLDGKEVFTITKAELFEVSIVGVPMNQDSTFTVVSKDALKSGSLRTIEADMLRQRGAHVQANIMEMLEAQEEDLEDFYKSMTRRTKRSKEDLRKVMLGAVAPDQLFKSKACAFLDCEYKNLYEGDEALEKLNAVLASISEGKSPSEALLELKAETEEEDEHEETKFVTGSQGDDDAAHTHTYDEGDSETSETNEHRHPIGEDGSIGEAEGHTHSADPEAKAMDEGDEEDEDPKDPKDPPADDEAAKAEEALKDFQDCVNEKIPALINDEGMEQDQAVAAAIEACSSEKGCDIGAFKNTAYAKCFEAAKAYAETGEWKDIDFAEIKQALAEGEDGTTTAIDTEQTEKDGITDPHLMAAQQTNVLLGTMISKFDSLLEVMAQQMALDNTEDDEEDDVEEDDSSSSDEEKTKMRIALARRKQLELQERMNSLKIG